MADREKKPDSLLKAHWRQSEWIISNAILGDVTLVPFTTGAKSEARKRYETLDKAANILRRPSRKGYMLPIPGRLSPIAKPPGPVSWWFGYPDIGVPGLPPLVLIPYTSPIPEWRVPKVRKYEIGNVLLDCCPFSITRIERSRRNPHETLLHVMPDPLPVRHKGNWHYVVPPNRFLMELRRISSSTPMNARPGSAADAAGLPVEALRERDERYDPAVAIFTDGTKLLYFAVHIVERGEYFAGFGMQKSKGKRFLMVWFQDETGKITRVERMDKRKPATSTSK